MQLSLPRSANILESKRVGQRYGSTRRSSRTELAGRVLRRTLFTYLFARSLNCIAPRSSRRPHPGGSHTNVDANAFKNICLPGSMVCSFSNAQSNNRVWISCRPRASKPASWRSITPTLTLPIHSTTPIRIVFAPQQESCSISVMASAPESHNLMKTV